MLHNKKKVVLFKIIAVCLPVLFVAGLELAFRFFDVGRDLNLFITSSLDGDYLSVNPDVSHRFYVQEENAVKGTDDQFLKEKGPDSFRIFVLGESTSLGFPFRHHLSFASMLRYRLQESLPEKLIEVVNLSLTGVNSYALVEFANEVIDQKPDAVIIAAGHNEYYGALGVASTSTLGNNSQFVRWAIQARKLRSVQVLSNAYGNLQENLIDQPIDLRKNLMERMVSNKEISQDGKLYQNGLNQFKENITLSLEKFQASNIPVFYLECISNEKDQQPFISKSKNSEQQEYLESEIKKLKRLTDVGEKIKGFHGLVDMDESYAMTHYHLAKAYLETENTLKAKAHFIRAKEYDNLRFRAPEEINEIAQMVCKQTGAMFIPLREILEGKSEDKLLGNSLFMEHLHPNTEGHFLLADALYQKVGGLAKAKFQKFKTVEFNDAQALFPVNVVDSLFGVYTTLILKEGWPFNEPIQPLNESEKTMEEALAGGLVVGQISWENAMDKLYRYYVGEGELEKAFIVAETVAMANPFQLFSQKKAGQLAFSLDKWDRVVYYFQVANTIHPEIDNLKHVVQALLKSNRLSESIPYLISINKENPTDKPLEKMLITVQEIVSLEFKLEDGKTLISDDYQRLAANYLLLGNLESAKKYAGYLLDKNPQNKAGQLILKQIELRLES